MGLKIFEISLKELNNHKYLRLDEKFWYTTKNLVVYNYIFLKDLFNLINGNSYTEYYTEEQTDNPYIRIHNLTFKYDINDNDIVYLDESCKINEEKRLKKDDLVLATIGATIGKINLAREFKGGTFSNNTIVLRLKNKENHNAYFYEKFFQYDLLQKYIWGVVSQKAQPNLQSYDIKNIKIPIISKKNQDKIVIKIKPIENKIKKQKIQIIPTQEIINKVFAKEFEFDLEKFEILKKEKFFEMEINKIDTPLIRSTVIQNKSSSNFLKLFLFKNSIFLKDIIINKIKRGKQPEYVDNGVKVIKTMNIQDGKVIFDDVQYVSESFLEQNKEKAAIYTNDLLLTSTGMGRGKFALYEDKESCFADSHISIIRFKQELFIPNFLNYYCKSFLGTEQLKYIEMQIKGTPEIYEEQLNYFQIPNISIFRQQEIVDEIKAELDKQEEINQKITCLRNLIDLIIEQFINL